MRGCVLPFYLLSTGDAEFMRSIWQCSDSLDTEGDTGTTKGARIFTVFLSALQRIVTPRPAAALLSVSAQGQAGRGSARATRCHIRIVTAQTASCVRPCVSPFPKL